MALETNRTLALTGILASRQLQHNRILAIRCLAEVIRHHPVLHCSIKFHTGHKYLVMSHCPVTYRQLGQMLSDLTRASLADIADRYIARLMQALSVPATRKRHTNVLQHLLGYLKSNLDSAHRADLGKTIDAYRRGEFPLVVPIRLLQHHFSMHPHPYINEQVYLSPHPQALQLRNNL
jgi:uncharacterized protein YbgA (DUF1722 family)